MKKPINRKELTKKGQCYSIIHQSVIQDISISLKLALRMKQTR